MTEIWRSEVWGVRTDLQVKASKLIFNLSRQNNDVKIERLLFSATTGAIFILKVALSDSDTGGLNATFRMKIAPMVAENKRRSIFAWSFWRDKLNISLLAFTC